MKILHVARQYYPTIGGIQTVIGNLAHQLQELGHEVDVLALDRAFTSNRSKLQSEEIIDNIRVKRISFLGPRQYAIAPKVLIGLKDYDLIHLHSTDFFLDFLANTKFLHKKPIVLTSHGAYFHTRFLQSIKKTYFRIVTRFNLRNVSDIVCVSQHDYEMFDEIALSRKLHFIPNGINYYKLASLDIKKSDPNLFLTVGRLVKNKRLDNMLKTFALVVQKNPAANLLILGPDGGSLSLLKQLCCQLNISNNVNFLGRVSEEDMYQYLEKASIWLSSATYEGFGIALLESMAAGCIPVVSPLPAFNYILSGTSRGYITNFAKQRQASKCILKVLELTPVKRQEMALLARERASQFSWEIISKRINNLYMKIVGNL